WEAQGIDIDEFVYFRRWLNELAERPALQRGMEVGAGETQSYADLSEEELKQVVALLYNQRARPAPTTGGILD
ncbi:MAG: hypothetical protein R3228_17550, partial [Halioglobus sp.]|nr:hypothetical protein [Halioglobus sp.]